MRRVKLWPCFFRYTVFRSLRRMLYVYRIADSCINFLRWRLFAARAAVSSSHNSAAERQFGSPVEYAGGQRAPIAQWTVTGAGAFIIGSDQINGVPYITDVLPGRTVDKGIDDISNMGAAMAPQPLPIRLYAISKSQGVTRGASI